MTNLFDPLAPFEVEVPLGDAAEFVCETLLATADLAVITAAPDDELAAASPPVVPVPVTLIPPATVAEVTPPAALAEVTATATIADCP